MKCVAIAFPLLDGTFDSLPVVGAFTSGESFDDNTSSSFSSDDIAEAIVSAFLPGGRVLVSHLSIPQEREWW